jgi:hypothetical protein
MSLKDESCTSWLDRLLRAPVRSLREEQHMGLGGLFSSISCHTLFLPATSRQQLTNLAGSCWILIAPRAYLQPALTDHVECLCPLCPQRSRPRR